MGEGSADIVIVTVTPPKKAFKREDKELKAALQKHQPQSHASVTVARNFEDMVSHKADKIGSAVRGIEATIGAVFADSLIEAVTDCPGAPPAAKGMLELIRSSKLRNELYYDDEKMDAAPMPPLQHVLPKFCGSMSPAMAKASEGLGDVLDEMKSVALEGLPYGWELIFDMKNVNPTPILDLCSK